MWKVLHHAPNTLTEDIAQQNAEGMCPACGALQVCPLDIVNQTFPQCRAMQTPLQIVLTQVPFETHEWCRWVEKQIRCQISADFNACFSFHSNLSCVHDFFKCDTRAIKEGKGHYIYIYGCLLYYEFVN